MGWLDIAFCAIATRLPRDPSNSCESCAKNAAHVVSGDNGDRTCEYSMLGKPEINSISTPVRSSSSLRSTAACAIFSDFGSAMSRR